VFVLSGQMLISSHVTIQVFSPSMLFSCQKTIIRHNEHNRCFDSGCKDSLYYIEVGAGRYKDPLSDIDGRLCPIILSQSLRVIPLDYHNTL
jgi:hypothetical protein